MKQDGVVLNQSQASGLGDRAVSPANLRSTPVAGMKDVHVFRGRTAALDLQSMLVSLSQRTGQTGAMDWLHHFVSSPDSLDKTPYILMVGGEGGLAGALLLYEYRVAGLGTRVFATDDILGTRTLIAPESCRIAVARMAIDRLMEIGAIVALVSVDTGERPESAVAASSGNPYTTAVRVRTPPRHLRLESSMEATLAKMGDDTRRNFRRYRRRAVEELGAEFVPEISISREEFVALDRMSTNPVERAVIDWRYGLLQQASDDGRILLCGIRSGDGEWLSLIGGRRDGATTHIDWQFNRAGLPHSSLCTAMRAFLLEHEIARGTRRLVFEGGTPHPMRFAFESAPTVDLLAIRRNSARAWLLRRFADQIFPEKNFLRAALRNFSSQPPQDVRDPSCGLSDAA